MTIFAITPGTEITTPIDLTYACDRDGNDLIEGSRTWAVETTSWTYDRVLGHGWHLLRTTHVTMVGETVTHYAKVHSNTIIHRTEVVG